MNSKPVKRVLIANRGEIAVRIMRAAHELGMETVAVFSEADQGARHVRMADHRVLLEGNAARDTYLNQEKLIAAALQSGADAVHPGYGFLAENASFAAAVSKAGLRFVGPAPQTIALMGDKHQARRQATAVGVPVLEGTEPGQPQAELEQAAKRIGFPLMIKAVAGGSGRGMRVVPDAARLMERLAEARREAEAAFGNGDVYLERFLEAPRHIEVQVFGDSQGNVVHLDARECSVQRRHQKLVEEAPAPLVNTELRARLLEAAVTLARSVRYEGAGTVEFLVEMSGGRETAFYFLEMNTRIQVEHPVTEMVTGYDLVKEQLLVASGHPLSFTQEEVRCSGHAIEFRIYAEDVDADFRPVTGTVHYLSRPGGPGLREDSWVEPGTKISPYYDSLLAKLVVWGKDRGEALVRARAALNEYVIEGLPTTLGFHRWLLHQADFHAGVVDVFWIGRSYRGQQHAARATGPIELPSNLRQ